MGLLLLHSHIFWFEHHILHSLFRYLIL